MKYLNINEALPGLLGRLESQGAEVGTRQGSRTKELTHVGVTLTQPRDRYITIPHRRANLAAQIAETMWVLSGREDIEWLSRYLPRAADFSDDGLTWRGAYGTRLRAWPSEEGPVDQLHRLFELLQEDPITRRAVATIYDPARDLPGKGNRAFKDIPCNNWLHFTSRLGELDLHVATRSNDIWWGWSGINAFEWSALQEIMAAMLGVDVGSLHFSITSLHVYDQHWRVADKVVDRDRNAKAPRCEPSPRFDASTINHDWDQLEGLLGLWMAAEEAIREGDDPEATERLVEHFPEPMLKSWLRVLQWWWSGGNTNYLRDYEGTDLYEAMEASLQPKRDISHRTPVVPAPVINLSAQQVPLIPEEKWDAAVVTPQWQTLAALHAEKHAAYGDSWKRRGEMLGILANIARKVDRLTAGTTTSDESLTDTAADLLIYAIKYRLWLMDEGAPSPLGFTADLRDLGEPERVAAMLQAVLTHSTPHKPEGIEGTFTGLEAMVSEGDPLRWRQVDTLIRQAHGALNKAAWVASNATRQWKGYEA